MIGENSVKQFGDLSEHQPIISTASVLPSVF